MKEISDKDLELIIIELTEEGNKFHDENNYKNALEKYLLSWEKIPEPKLEWEISSWISACIYSAYFDMENYIAAKEWAIISLKTKSSEIDTSPYINLGMVYYELEQYDISYKYFQFAYNLGKKRAFKERPKKYLNFYFHYPNSHCG